MNLTGWKEVIGSTSIDRYRYKHGHLDVIFKNTGHMYRYYDVPQPLVRELEKIRLENQAVVASRDSASFEDSLGSYFANHIRNANFDYAGPLNVLEDQLVKLYTGGMTPLDFADKIEDLLTQKGKMITGRELVNLIDYEDHEVRLALSLVRNEKIYPYLNHLIEKGDSKVRDTIKNRKDLPPEVKERFRS